MAENFRNKQWFKNMSQERKDEICKKFDIDEKTLKKAGRETEDGRIVINLLKIDHLNHRPESWKTYNDILSSNTIELCGDTIEEKVNNIKYIYSLFNDVKFLKYKESVHNNLLVKQTAKYVNEWINEYKNPENSADNNEYFAYQIFSHVRSLIESDLKIVKN